MARAHCRADTLTTALDWSPHGFHPPYAQSAQLQLLSTS